MKLQWIFLFNHLSEPSLDSCITTLLVWVSYGRVLNAACTYVFPTLSTPPPPESLLKKTTQFLMILRMSCLAPWHLFSRVYLLFCLLFLRQGLAIWPRLPLNWNLPNGGYRYLLRFLLDSVVDNQPPLILSQASFLSRSLSSCKGAK